MLYLGVVLFTILAVVSLEFSRKIDPRKNLLLYLVFAFVFVFSVLIAVSCIEHLLPSEKPATHRSAGLCFFI